MLTWDDVQLRTDFRGHPDHRTTNGKLRVTASLKGAAFVNVILWQADWKDSPEQRAVIMLLLLRKLASVRAALNRYSQDIEELEAAS